jgi:hypothetical protein
MVRITGSYFASQNEPLKCASVSMVRKPIQDTVMRAQFYRQLLQVLDTEEMVINIERSIL